MVMALTATVLGGLRLLVHDIVKVSHELFAIDAWGVTKKVTHESHVDQTLSGGTQLHPRGRSSSSARRSGHRPAPA